MPGATVHYGFPFQLLSDPPHGPNLGEDGFAAVDTALKGAEDTAAAATAAVDADVTALDVRVTALEGPPRAHLRQTTLQPVTSNSFTVVSFQTEDIDSPGGHTPGDPGRYYAQIPGTYEFAGAVAFAVSGTGQRATRWRHNGAVVPGSASSHPSASAAIFTNLPARTIQLDLAFGDYVELQCWHNVGSPLDTAVTSENQSSMSVKYIGT